MNSAGPCLLLLLFSLLLLLESSMSVPANGAKLGRRKRETTADKENNSVTTHRVDTSIRIETVVEKRMAEESGKHEDHSAAGSSSSDESESGAAGRDEDYAAFARDHGYPLPEAPVPEVEYSLPALQPEGTHAKDGTHAAVKHNHNQITQLGKDYGGLKVNHDIHTNRLDMLDDNLHVREHEHSGLAAQQLANEVKNGELSFNQFVGIKKLEKSTKTMDQTQRTMDTDLEMLGKSRDEFMSKTNQALSDNEATIGQNSSRLGKAESGLKEEMEKLTADGQRIDGIQSNLSKMDGMVTTHENKINAHGTVLDTAKEDIKGLQKVQTEHTEGINQLGQKQSDFEETNQKQQAEHMQNLATVHSQVTGLDSALATNQLTLKDQGIQLGNLETGLTAEETARKEGHATHMGLIQGQADLSRVHDGRIKGQAQQHGQLVNGLKKANQKHGELAADFSSEKSSNQGIVDAQGKLIEENGRAIGGVQTVVAGHGPRLTAAESDITTLGTGLKGAKADVQRHEGDIERHRQDLETKKDKLTSVDTTLLNHDKSIERLHKADKARVKDIEKVNSHIGEVHTGLVGEIAATDGQVAQNTIGIQKNRESLERQDRDLADTNVILTDQGGQLSVHDSKYKDHVSLMQQIEERFDQNDTKVKDLLVNQHEIDNALVQSGMALGDNVLKGEQQVMAANKAALKEVQDAIAAMKEKMDFIKQKQAAQDHLLRGHIGTTQTSSTKTKTTIEENNMFESGAAA